MNNNMNFDPMTGQPINQTVQQINTNQQPIQSQKKKKNVNPKLLIIIAVLIVVFIVGIIFVPKLFNNKDKSDLKESLTGSTSFWMRNDENLYAMFDIYGKQLTDFQFTSVSSEFVNGTAKVKNKNGEYGLISSTGKMIIDFGQYEYIFEEYAVYEMIDKENNKYLYNSFGKLVRQLENDESINSYIGEYKYAIIESETEYKLIDHNGDVVIKFSRVDDDDIEDPTVNSVGDYVSVFYNKNNYIVNISTKKVVLSFPEERHFCINKVNENNDKEIILNSCTDGYRSQEKYGYKFVRDGKIVFSRETDGYSSMYFEGNNVVLNDDYEYVLDDKGNDALKNSYTIYKDYKNYIVEAEGSFNGAELYVNGSLKEKLECDNIQGGYAKHGVYLLDHCSGYGNGNKIYINSDGTRINDKSYERAYEFDENGYASVSEDAENFYLINLKGEKVSDYYSNDRTAEKIYNIRGTKNLYYGTNEDGTTTIFEVNGKKLLTGNITFSMTSTIAEGEYVTVEKDNKYIVHELLKNKDVVILDSKPNMYSKYFTTSANSKTQYYSYITGKIFYEE